MVRRYTVQIMAVPAWIRLFCSRWFSFSICMVWVHSAERQKKCGQISITAGSWAIACRMILLISLPSAITSVTVSLPRLLTRFSAGSSWKWWKPVKFDWPDLSAPKRFPSISCYGLLDQIGVLCDGTVVPCCLDHEGDITLENLFRQDLEEILASQGPVPSARALPMAPPRRSSAAAAATPSASASKGVIVTSPDFRTANLFKFTKILHFLIILLTFCIIFDRLSLLESVTVRSGMSSHLGNSCLFCSIKSHST